MEAMRSALRERVVAGVAAVQLPLTCAANPALLTSRASEGTGSKPSASKERSDSVKPGGREGSATPGAPPIPGAGAQAAAGAGAGAVPLLPKLLTDYLSHTRCWRTAAILTRDLLSKVSLDGDVSTASVYVYAMAGCCAVCTLKCVGTVMLLRLHIAWARAASLAVYVCLSGHEL